DTRCGAQAANKNARTTRIIIILGFSAWRAARASLLRAGARAAEMGHRPPIRNISRTGLLAQFQPVVMLCSLRRALADSGHSYGSPRMVAPTQALKSRPRYGPLHSLAD